MELKQDTHDHVALNAGDEVKFDISPEFVTHAIGMLVKQYSNPEMAFIRETCSNAYDAHTAAGNQDTPFDIHIPSTFAPYIEIRDYGTGISKEFMLNRYVSVGDSTKRKSNTEIGGFGIGRLSFLIVTEQAAITSYYNGMKYSFTCRYNEAGILVISQTDERKTDEPNGLRLKFPVQVARIEAFRNAARNYFKRVTSTMANFTGDSMEIVPTKYSHRGDSWGIRENDGDRNIFAIMGNIAYPIQTNTLRYDTRFNEVNSVLESRIDLFFDIGEVIPLPTRENLDMCDHTLNALLARLKTLKTDLMERVEVDVAKAKNLWQAEKAYTSILSGMSNNMRVTMQGMDLKFKGKTLKGNNWNFLAPTIERDHATATTTNVDGTTSPLKIEVPALHFNRRVESGINAVRDTSWGRESHYVHASHSNYKTFCFIFNDTGRGVRPTIDFNYPNKETNIALVSGTPEAWAEFKATEIKRGFNPKGFRLASTLLPKPKRVRALSDQATLSYLRADRTMPSHSGIKSHSASIKYGEVTGKKQYYVLTSNYQLNDKDYKKLQELRSFCQTGMLERINILVLNKNRQNLMADETEWVHFSEYVKVDPKKVAKKKQQVYRTVYYALRYNRMYQTVKDHLAPNRVTVNMRINKKTYSGWGKGPSWRGDAVRSFKGLREESLELDYFISAYGKYLESVKGDAQLGKIANAVLNRNSDMHHDHARNLCSAYGIDWMKIRGQAAKTRPVEDRIKVMLDSQTYLVLSSLAHRGGFDFKQLKKELSQ